MGELISYQEFMFRKFKKEISKTKTEKELKKYLVSKSTEKIPEEYEEKYRSVVSEKLTELITS